MLYKLYISSIVRAFLRIEFRHNIDYIIFIHKSRKTFPPFSLSILIKIYRKGSLFLEAFLPLLTESCYN